jgi:hypothetical protein
MCSADVNPVAREALASLLRDIRKALAAEDGTDPEAITIGPVDFGATP